MNSFPAGPSRRKTAVTLGEVRKWRSEVRHVDVSLLLVLLTVLVSVASAADGAPTLLYSLFDPSTNVQYFSLFGSSVAVDGNIAVISAPDADVGAVNAGVVKLYDVANGTLLYTLKNPAPALADYFGKSVAISGRRIVIGSHFHNFGGVSAGGAYVYDLDSTTPSVPITTLTNPSPAHLDWFGSSVAISGTRVVIAAPYDDTGATNAGSAYVYELASATPFLPTTVLTNPTPAASDRFGYSVAISDTRVVVGAPWENVARSNAVAAHAYLYDLLSAAPHLPVATISDPNPATNNYFGFSVAISGTSIVVGSPQFNAPGKAYIYDLTGPTPALPALTLTNPSPAAGDYFGGSVALSGTRVVVGAELDKTEAHWSGRAYVYDVSGATPSLPIASLINPSPAEYDYFGRAVAIAGTRVVVGAPYDDSSAPDAGSAYVFDLAGAIPTTPIWTLNSCIPSTGELFGSSVSVSGSRVVVGAYLDDSGAGDAGAAYVYDLAGATPTQPILILTNPSPAEGDYFGASVAISGTRMAIGVYRDDTGTNDSGSAYVYDLSSGTPAVPVVTLTNPSPVRYSYFGSSVAISGQHVVVGRKDSAYVYDLSSATPGTPVLTLTNPAPIPGLSAVFGSPVAISGTRVVVAAWNEIQGDIAYVYDVLSDTPTMPVATLVNLSPVESDRFFFGMSVAISGTLVVVGTEANDTGATNAGSAYVYDLSSPDPYLPMLTLTNPRPDPYGLFGCSVSIADTLLVVGAYGNHTDTQYVGNAYVYDLTGDTPTVPMAVLNNPTPAFNDRFGSAVGIDGTTVVAGAPFDDTDAVDRGAAYVFSVGPLLRVTPTAPGLAMLSWTPTNLPGFVLQYSDSPTSAHWLDVPGGGAMPVTISTTNGSRFYRMFKP